MGKLTKVQQAELSELRRECAMAKALSWPNFPKPVPLQRRDAATGAGPEWVEGYAINTYGETVRFARGDSVSTVYANDNGTFPSGYGHGTKDRPPLYATQRDAWLAMYHELCREYAATLARILDKANAAEQAT